jgi:hypothetical protein
VREQQICKCVAALGAAGSVSMSVSTSVRLGGDKCECLLLAAATSAPMRIFAFDMLGCVVAGLFTPGVVVLRCSVVAL